MSALEQKLTARVKELEKAWVDSRSYQFETRGYVNAMQVFKSIKYKTPSIDSIDWVFGESV